MLLGAASACADEKPLAADIPMEEPCGTEASTTISMADMIQQYPGQLIEWTVDEVLEGFVISSDREGNIFGSIYLQDQLKDPEFGIQLLTDLLDTHILFPPGTKVRLALKGLYLGQKGKGFALGSRRDIFGNPTLDRLPAAATLQILKPSCESSGEAEPTILPIDSLTNRNLFTLVRIPELEAALEYTDSTFSQEGIASEIPLLDCKGNEISLINSGFSQFFDQPLPGGNGSATGILLGSENHFQLLIRDPLDLAFDQVRCTELYPPMSSELVFISELADPDNEAGARFLELYNAGEQAVELRGWVLQRYTNDNPQPGVESDLSGLVLPPKSCLVFSANPEIFEAIYGRPPDAVLRVNGPSDSNGDDTILLIDPFGEVVDVFGIPGEDGSGTAHEFEDGRALRRAEVVRASPEFIPGQWIIYNDTGDAGTIAEPQEAPADFTPGIHPDPGG